MWIIKQHTLILYKQNLWTSGDLKLLVRISWPIESSKVCEKHFLLICTQLLAKCTCYLLSFLGFLHSLVSAGRQEGGGVTNMPQGSKLYLELCVINYYFEGLFNVKKNETQRLVVGGLNVRLYSNSNWRVSGSIPKLCGMLILWSP